ncbi:MAG: aspartate carbamoyltransferase [Rhodospirillaceae bacterium]|nr:aspartate carbamoyltransferase [Rhodospirillaceae bacterium]MBT5456304.1 aspartate carbamoyltransferase [Rhodospirillaceae bacterium]
MPWRRAVISVDQFSKSDISEIFGTADRVAIGRTTPLGGKTIANLFYEPSTRTSSSFYAAMTKLGGNVIPINEVNFSSVTKGETLEDTIRTLECYADAIVLRHYDEDASERAVAVSSVPIINAGNGAGEHPTQALLDLYTIQQEQGRIDGLTITMMGDLKYGRTVHSLTKLLRLYDVHLQFVAPEELQMPQQYLAAGDTQHLDLDDVIDGTDVLYVTRVQKERLPGAIDIDFFYAVTPEHMERARKDMVLMHPLPRVGEIPPSLDDDPRAAYFRQMKYGLYVRMALLVGMLGGA